MRERVWVVSELYAPEETSTGYLLTRIAEGLAGEFDTSALCGQPTYSARGRRAPWRERLNGVDVRRCRSTTLDKDVVAFRLINLVTITASMFWQAVRHVRRGDVVMAVTNPPLLPFIALLACRLRGARPVLVVHDVYPEVMIVTGMVRAGSRVERIGLALNRWLYGSMDRIVVLGRDMEALARARLAPTHYDRVVVIPNWADVEDVHPAPKADNPLLAELGWARDTFVVQYAGNMGRPNEIETIVEAATRLRDDPAVRFLFIGSGVKRARLAAVVRDGGLGNVRLAGTRPRSDQPVFLNACDVGVVPLIRGMAGVGVPSRLYNILAAGKPVIVIADEQSEPALVVREEKVGWVVAPGDVDGLIAAIRDACQNPGRLAEMGERARRVAASKYTLGHVVAKYREMVRAIVQGAA